MHPPGDHPAHDQRFPYRGVIGIDLYGVRCSTTGRSGEDSNSTLELPFRGESVADDAADAAFIGDAEGGGAVDAERAGEIGAVESQELVPIG